MKVLGISYGYHDASASVVVDGMVRASAAESAFTRQKHDSSFPTNAIEYCLRSAETSIGEIDRVVFHEDPHAKFSRVLTSSLAPFPHSRKEFTNSVKSWLGKKLWAVPTISSRLGVPPSKITHLAHHFSHAVQAFLGSRFDDAAVLVVDAVGDWASSALYEAGWHQGRPVVTKLLEISYPHSLGLVYSALTAYLGFSPNDSECSTMALAAFGRPVWVDKIRKIVDSVDGDLYRVDQSYFNFANFYRGPVTEKFLREFGPERDPKQPLPWRSFGPSGKISSEDQRFVDIAHSLQVVLEERVLRLAEKLHELHPSPNLCFAGGVAMNCVLNYKLLTHSPFTNLYIPPDPGDGGTSIGTSLYCGAQADGISSAALGYTPYLGPDFDEHDDVAMLAHVKPDHLLPYLKDGLAGTKGTAWKTRHLADESELAVQVAELLMAGKIVGWFQAKMEIGPRALGNRSLLIRPDAISLATRLSNQVKQRASFRPYALSIAEEDGCRILDTDRDSLRYHSWMQYAVPVRAEIAERVQCGLHVDGTTRPQICSAADNPRFHRLLTAFGERFGLKALVNTSFNPKGYPIVCSPLEALIMFARTDIDALVLNQTLVWKER